MFILRAGIPAARALTGTVASGGTAFTTVSAVRILVTLAGGRGTRSSCASSTAPVSASTRIHAWGSGGGVPGATIAAPEPVTPGPDRLGTVAVCTGRRAWAVGRTVPVPATAGAAPIPSSADVSRPANVTWPRHAARRQARGRVEAMRPRLLNRRAGVTWVRSCLGHPSAMIADPRRPPADAPGSSSACELRNYVVDARGEGGHVLVVDGGEHADPELVAAEPAIALRVHDAVGP